MTKNEAIQRIQVAIGELRVCSASRNPFEASTANDAIFMLQSVIDALEKHRLEYTPFVALGVASYG